MADAPVQSFLGINTRPATACATSTTSTSTSTPEMRQDNTGNNNHSKSDGNLPTKDTISVVDTTGILSLTPTHSTLPSQHLQHRRPTCCCGQDACVYRTQSQNALEDLERDVRTAAQLGQALIQRHESYVAESEFERGKMVAQIANLEAEKQTLEVANASVIEENRHLLDQLEAVNNAVAESDAHVTNLQATLISTQQELHRLTSLAARTARLDQQLADFEQERATWHITLNNSEESEKAAVRRWQQAERSIATLQEQVERIERDGREEQERHAEIIARMERRHAVQTELTSDAGRLGSAATVRNPANGAGGQSVVSHFVKDILQDNANLQLGIVELREMLQTSNDEVEALRGRLADRVTQPTSPSLDTTPKQRDLRNELDRASSQELHVHHHYHAPQAPTPKPQVLRKKKKRYGNFAGHSSGYSTPRTSISYGGHSPAATILQQTAVTIPHNNKRWSAHSQQTYYSTSGPSSPQSTTNRTSSLYDRVFSDAGLDSSRPTTPDSEAPASPVLLATNVKRSSVASHRTRSAPVVHRHGQAGSSRQSLGSILDVEAERLLELDEDILEQTVIPEEEADWANASSPDMEVAPTEPSFAIATERQAPFADQDLYSPGIRRVRSHDSLFSVAGMDVHTLRGRPSQLLTPYAGRLFTSNPVLGDAQAHVLHTADFSRPADRGQDLLIGMASDRKTVTPRPSLGQKVGGWVFGRWGTSPSLSVPQDDASVVSDPASRHSVDTSSTNDAHVTPKRPVVKHRMPGINQPGPIFGFLPEVRAPVTPPVMKHLDDDALRIALDSGHIRD